MLTKTEDDRRLELIAQSCGEVLSKEERIELSNLQRGAQPHISCPEVFNDPKPQKRLLFDVTAMMGEDPLAIYES